MFNQAEIWSTLLGAFSQCKIHVADLHVLFLEFLITIFEKWDKVWILKVEKIKDLLTVAIFLEYCEEKIFKIL